MEEVSCDKRIVGASFSIHPMSDDFVQVILGALEETDTSAVWMETDDVSTTVRGKMGHIFDVTRAVCLHAARTGKHVAFQATYQVGGPHDPAVDAFLELDDQPRNGVAASDDNLFAAAKFALYPLSAPKSAYIEIILSRIEMMKAYGDVTRTSYGTKVSGSLVQIFAGLEAAFRKTITDGSTHTTMSVSISMNSPSHKGN